MTTPAGGTYPVDHQGEPHLEPAPSTDCTRCDHPLRLHGRNDDNPRCTDLELTTDHAGPCPCPQWAGHVPPVQPTAYLDALLAHVDVWLTGSGENYAPIDTHHTRQDTAA